MSITSHPRVMGVDLPAQSTYIDDATTGFGPCYVVFLRSPSPQAGLAISPSSVEPSGRLI